VSRPGPTPWTRRALLGTAAIGLPIISAGCAQSAGGGGVARQAPGNRRVCIGYALWHRDNHWDTDPNKAWGTPEIGYYRSDDPSVLARHANWLSGAEVDFVIIDWSNDLSMDIRRPGGPGVQRFIEESTVKLFDSWTKMSSAPRVALMIGNPGDPGAVNDGRLTAKANEVYELFVANKARAPLLETYLGKPLLLVYAMTPSPWGHSLPPWHDDRFTVRFITGFLTQQPSLLGPGGLSRYGYWSFVDRGTPTHADFDGRPECVTVVAAWTGSNSSGRRNGQTYLTDWEYARKLGPRFVLAGTFNEWWATVQETAESSRDIEPSREYGELYLNILRSQARLFKDGQ
jgi:hypothetical protein